jgi:uncharacterized protein
MAVYLTPGVYRTPQAVAQDRFVLVRTDIAGFIGFAERGPLPEDDPEHPLTAVRKLTSWKEFQVHFGGFIPSGYLAYAVRAFLENGGTTCYVARVAASTAAYPGDRPAFAQFTVPSGPPVKVGNVASIGAGFLANFTLPGNDVLAAGDLVRIDRVGLSTLNTINDSLGGSSFLLAEPLEAPHAAGDALLTFPSAFRLRARSAGNWGNSIRARITPLDNGAFGLRVTVDRGPLLAPTEQEFYKRLTLDDQDASDYAPAVLRNNSQLVDIIPGSGPLKYASMGPLGKNEFYLSGGRNGLSAVELRDFLGSDGDLRGLRLLEEFDEIAMLCAPDASFQGTRQWKPITPQLPPCTPKPPVLEKPSVPDPTSKAAPVSESDSLTIKRRMIEQCERLRYRVAIIDPPDNYDPNRISSWPMTSGLRTRSSRFAALYYPWLRVPDPLGVEGLNRRIPPSGHVAGVYARNDLTFGVDRPPANYALEFAADTGVPISDEQQEGLNPNRVNAIRTLPGRGIRVWGARSLASDQDSEWEFIHVRRLMSAIEKSVEISSRWVVFENNDFALRNTLTHSLNVLLGGIWARGGLKGASAAQGFYVKCDETNNPQSSIDNGRLICEIGVAVAAPMEFLVFEIRRDAGAMEVAET